MHLLAVAAVLVAVAVVAVAAAAAHIDPVVGILVAEVDTPAVVEVDTPAAVAEVGIVVADLADSPVAVAAGIVVADLAVGIALVGLEDCNHTL